MSSPFTSTRRLMLNSMTPILAQKGPERGDRGTKKPDPMEQTELLRLFTVAARRGENRRLHSKPGMSDERSPRGHLAPTQSTPVHGPLHRRASLRGRRTPHERLDLFAHL